MRVVTRILLYVLAVLVVLGPAAYFARDVLPARIVTWALPAVLGVSGIGTVSLKVDSVGLDRIVLSNVRLGDRPDFTAGRIVAEYEPLALLRGAVSSIEVRDALVRGRLDAGGGLSFGALDPLIALAGGGGDGDASAPPAVTLNTVTLELQAPQGSAIVTVDGNAGPVGSGRTGASLDIRVALSSTTMAGGGRAYARATADLLRHQDGRGDVNLRIVGGSVELRDIAAASLAGEARLTLDPDLRPVEAAGRLHMLRLGLLGTTLPAAEIAAGYGGGGLTLHADLGGEAAARRWQADLYADRLTAPRVAVTLAAEGDIVPPSVLAFAAAGRPEYSADGRMRLRLSGTVPGLPAGDVAGWIASLADGAALTGRVEVSGTLALPSPDYLEVAADGAIAVAAAGGTVSLETLRPTTLSADGGNLARIAGRHGITLPAAAAARPGADLRIILGTAERSFATTWRSEPDLRLGLAGPVAAQIDRGPRLAIAGEAVVHLGAPGWLAEVGHADIVAESLAMDGVKLSRLEVAVDGSIGPAAATVRFDGLAAFSTTLDGLAADGRLKLAGRFVSQGDTIEVSATRGSLALNRAVAGGGAVRLGAPATFAVSGPGAAPASLRLAPSGDAQAVSASAVLLAPREGVALIHDGRPVAFSFARLALDVSGVPAAGRLTAGVRLSGGGLRADFLPLAVTDGRAGLSWRMDGKAQGIVDATVAATLTDNARPARFAPVTVEARARKPDGRPPGAALTLDGLMQDRLGLARLTLAGSLDVPAGKAEARYVLNPVTFQAGGLHPEALFPVLAGTIDSATGTVSGAGTVDWNASAAPAVRAQATITLDGVSVTSRYGAVETLSGTVALHLLPGPRTEGEQVLRAAAISAPLPLAEPELRFSLDPDGTLHVASLKAGFAGGTVSANDMSYRSGQPISARLELAGADAAALAELIKLDGLVAEGRLSGSLPVVVDPDLGLTIKGGRLAAEGSGRIAYSPASYADALTRSGEQVDLMLQAVRNFQYRKLALDIDGAPGRDYAITLNLEGSNPDLYDGYPLRFNLNLSGRLDDIIRTNLKLYRLPERIDEMVREKQPRS